MKKKKFFSGISPTMIILCILLFVYFASILVLFGWGLITSFKDYHSDFVVNVFGLPKKWQFENYATIVKAFVYPMPNGKLAYIEDMLLNTVLYAVGCSFFSTFVTCITAYACGRFRYKFSGILSSVVIITMVLPVVGSLPSEMALAVEEAAKLDGASNFTIMVRIMFPIVMNTFGTVMLIKFIAFWNEYEIPLIYLPNHPTLSMAVAWLNMSTQNINGVNLSSVPFKMASSMVMLIPILILFLACQKKLIGSISMGGSKE
mgnify:CR=1 FL=1